MVAPLGARRHRGVRVVPQLEHTWAVMTDVFFLRLGPSVVVALGDVAGDAVGDTDDTASSFPFGDVDSFLMAAAAAGAGCATAGNGTAAAAATGGAVVVTGGWAAPTDGAEATLVVSCVATPSVCCCCCFCCCCCSCDTPSVILPDGCCSCVVVLCCVCISVGGGADCTGGIT